MFFREPDYIHIHYNHLMKYLLQPDLADPVRFTDRAAHHLLGNSELSGKVYGAFLNVTKILP